MEKNEINLAENLITIIHTARENALLFYAYLNDKPDAFLENYNYSRDEIKSGLKDVTTKYGVDEFTKMFL